MTIREVLNRVKSIRSPSPDEGDLINVISNVEAQIVTKITAPRGNLVLEKYSSENMNTVLIAPPPFDEIYVIGCAKEIDRRENQITNFNNDEREYKEIFGEFAAWYRRNNMPEQDNAHSVLF